MMFIFNTLLISLLVGGSASSSPRGQYGNGCAPHTNHTAQEVIAKLNLTANPEKGYFIQTFEDSGRANNRSYSTAIYYLLEGGQVSYWHRVLDAVEIWHHYAGAPLRLSLSWNDGSPVREQILGKDIFNNQSPQIAIQTGEWQHAESLGDWTLVGTTVAPGFTYDGVELAEPGWEPLDNSTSTKK